MEFLNSKSDNRCYSKIITLNAAEPFCQRNNHLTTRPKSNLDVITIVYTLDKDKRFTKAVKDNWSTFSINHDTRKQVYHKPILFSYKNHPSIENKVTKKKIEHNITSHNLTLYQTPIIDKVTYPARNMRYRVSGCASCPQLSQNYQCVSFQTHKCFPIEDTYSCDTKLAIYLLECPVCYKQYIGETGQTIRSRMKHHRNASQSNANRPIYRHLREHSISFQALKLTIIQQVP